MSWIGRVFGRTKAPAGRAHEVPASAGGYILGGYARPLPRRSAVEIMAAYNRSPIFRSIVSKIAWAVASGEYHVEVNGEHVPGHALERLMLSGAPGLAGAQAAMLEEVYLLGPGESFSILDLDRAGRPFRRWPIPPHWVVEVPVAGEGAYEVNPLGHGRTMRLPADRVLWRKDPDPLSPYGRGTGIGVATSDELEADERAAQHIAAVLANRALPETIVTGAQPGSMVEGAARRLQSFFEERFGGPRNQGRTLVAANPIEVHKLTPSFKELELSQLRESERTILIESFGIPPELIGKLSDSNRATIEGAEYLFAKHVVAPRMAARCDAFNELAPMYGDNVKVCFTSPVDEDRDFRAQVVSQNPHAFTLDEIRDLAGFAPLEDGRGERHAVGVSTRLVPVAPMAEQPADVRSAKAVRKELSPDDIEGLVNFLDDGEFSEDFAAAYEEVIAQFGEDALRLIGVGFSFTLDDPRVREFIEQNAADRSRLIVGTSRDNLRRELAEGLNLGEATSGLVKRIKRAVGTDSAARAKLISRTEIVRASNFGTLAALEQAGVEKREWLATEGDDRVRDAHRALDGQVRGVGEPFVFGAATAMYPGDFGVAELDINCRCGILPIFEDEPGAEPAGSREARVERWKVYDGARHPHEEVLEARVSGVLEAQAARIEREMRKLQ